MQGVKIDSQEVVKNSLQLIKTISFTLAVAIIIAGATLLVCNFIAIGANNKQADNSNTTTVKNALWTGTLIYIGSLIFVFASLWIPVTTLYKLIQQFAKENPNLFSFINK